MAESKKVLVNYLVEPEVKYGIRLAALKEERSANSLVAVIMKEAVEKIFFKHKVTDKDRVEFIEQCKIEWLRKRKKK